MTKSSLQYYSQTDFIIMFVRGVLLPILMVYSLGWVWGLALYFGAFQVYSKLMKYGYGYDALSALDEFFLLDNPKNRANIITVVKLDKMQDYE